MEPIANWEKLGDVKQPKKKHAFRVISHNLGRIPLNSNDWKSHAIVQSSAGQDATNFNPFGRNKSNVSKAPSRHAELTTKTTTLQIRFNSEVHSPPLTVGCDLDHGVRERPHRLR